MYVNSGGRSGNDTQEDGLLLAIPTRAQIGSRLRKKREPVDIVTCSGLTDTWLKTGALHAAQIAGFAGEFF